MFFDSLDKLPGLLPCMYRGLELHVADTSTEAGRRVLEYLFPGVDAAAYDDFGVLPSVITIEALIVSDDYKARAVAFQAAFERPGPGLFIHPWLGPMQVIMEEPAQISFSVRELRVVRISATFKRMPSALSGIASFAGDLATAIGSASSAASILATVVGTRVISGARAAAVTRSSRIVTSAAAAVTPSSGSARIIPQIIAALASGSPASPSAFMSWISSAGELIEAIHEDAAVAPAASAPVDVKPTPQSLMTVGIDLGTALANAGMNAPSDIDRSLLLAASTRFVSSAASQSAYATYSSRREALAFRTRMTTALDILIEQLEAFGTTMFQAETTNLSRAARNLNVAIVMDINEVIGRLPDVLTFRPERNIDAWAIALHVAGDTPSRMESVYLDIVARNGPRHPAYIEPGAVELLDIR